MAYTTSGEQGHVSGLDDRLASGTTYEISVQTLYTATNSMFTTGTNSQFLRGDRTWASPAGGGNVVDNTSSTAGNLVFFADTTGTLITDKNNTIGTLTATSLGSLNISTTNLSGTTFTATNLGAVNIASATATYTTISTTTVTASALSGLNVSCTNLVVGAGVPAIFHNSTTVSITGFAINGSSCTDVSIGLTGCTTASTILVTPTKDPGNLKIDWSGFCSTAGNARVRIANCSAGAFTFTTVVWRVDCWNH